MASSLVSFLLFAVIICQKYATAAIVPYDEESQPDDVSMMNKRELDFLDNMLSCTTNRTFFETMFDFGFYGCYCGFGGWGEPVDGVDRCCQAHDACYGATHARKGDQSDEDGGECYINIAAYAAPYKFKLHNCGTNDAYATCADIDQYKWYDFLPKCSVAICNCDRVLADCVAREPFNKKNRFYNRLKCFKWNDDDKNDDEKMYGDKINYD